MVRKRYMPAQKTAIVLELLKEEDTLAQVAARHGVHPNLLRKWKAQVLEGLPGLFTDEVQGRRASTPEQRRQTKWVVAGISGAVLVFALVGLSQVLVQGLRPVQVGGISALFAFSIYLLPWLSIPLSIGISMRRYRLWDTRERDHG